HHSRPRELALAAGGITVCAFATFASLIVEWALMRASATDAYVAAAQARLQDLFDAATVERAAELERTPSRARADSISLLADEERRIAEERRTVFTHRERELSASLTQALTDTQAQVTHRLNEWRRDLDRSADATKERLAELAERQRQLLSDA